MSNRDYLPKPIAVPGELKLRLSAFKASSFPFDNLVHQLVSLQSALKSFTFKNSSTTVNYEIKII